MKILVYAKGRRHFCPAQWCKILLNPGSTSRISPHPIGWAINTQTAFTSPFGKYKYIKVSFWLTQAPAYFQELMTGVLKDFPFAIAYLDDIIIFSRMAEGHLDHIRQGFKNIKECSLINETQQMPLLFQRDPVPWTHSKHHRHQTTTIKDLSHQKHAPT